MVMSKEHDPMISLKRPKQDSKVEEYKPPEYPSVHLSTDLGLDEKDVNKKMMATVEVRPKTISKTVENGKTRYTCELEILSIQF